MEPGVTAAKRPGLSGRNLWAAIAVVVVLIVAAVVIWQLHSSRRTVHELIPLYDNANPSAWAMACSMVDGAGDGSYIIADVGGTGGPGTAPATAWDRVINNCDHYGKASVLGYVWTGYGKGGMAQIPSLEAQVNMWYSFYPGKIAGIFFDGASDTVPRTTASNQGFYQSLAAYVHEKQGDSQKVVLNFGANPVSGWMFDSSSAKNADIVVTFEGSYDGAGHNPYTGWTAASWESKYPPDDFAALVYGARDSASTPQPSSACSSLRKQNLGYVYVGTTYARLPPYFSEFVSDC